MHWLVKFSSTPSVVTSDLMLLPKGTILHQHLLLCCYFASITLHNQGNLALFLRVYLMWICILKHQMKLKHSYMNMAIKVCKEDFSTATEFLRRHPYNPPLWGSCLSGRRGVAIMCFPRGYLRQRCAINDFSGGSHFAPKQIQPIFQSPSELCLKHWSDMAKALPYFTCEVQFSILHLNNSFIPNYITPMTFSIFHP